MRSSSTTVDPFETGCKFDSTGTRRPVAVAREPAFGGADVVVILTNHPHLDVRAIVV